MDEIICLRKRNLILNFRREIIIKSRNKIRIKINYITAMHKVVTQLYHSCGTTVAVTQLCIQLYLTNFLLISTISSSDESF